MRPSPSKLESNPTFSRMHRARRQSNPMLARGKRFGIHHLRLIPGVYNTGKADDTRGCRRFWREFWMRWNWHVFSFFLFLSLQIWGNGFLKPLLGTKSKEERFCKGRNEVSNIHGYKSTFYLHFTLFLNLNLCIRINTKIIKKERS